MTHTPGPWIAAWDKDDHHIWANGCDIAFLPGEEQGYEGGVKIKTLEANGKLMAAAPELLNALESFMVLYKQGQLVIEGDDGNDPIVAAALKAIAKATGEKP
jgi:hypothetical protein